MSYYNVKKHSYTSTCSFLQHKGGIFYHKVEKEDILDSVLLFLLSCFCQHDTARVVCKEGTLNNSSDWPLGRPVGYFSIHD